MTATDDHDPDALPLDPETERCLRYEINAAMNAVICTYRDIVNNHSHRGFWAPDWRQPEWHGPRPPGRTTIHADLRTVLECAEAISNRISAWCQGHTGSVGRSCRY